MKKWFKPKLVFVACTKDAMELHSKTPNSRVLDASTPTLQRHKMIAEHGAGEFETIIATPAMAFGWRAPVGCELTIADDFPADLREQAAARVPVRRPL